MVDLITTHTTDSIARLLEQYKNKPNLAAIIAAFTDQIQDVENETYAIIDMRAIELAYGEHLDNIGKIVDLARQGLGDDEYRTLLYVKIGQNTSQGDPEKIISIYKLLTGGTYVHYVNLTDAEVQLQTDVNFSDQAEANVKIESIQQVVGAGVRVAYLIYADADEPFVYDGTNPNVPGLGYDDTNGTSGGKYSEHWTLKYLFAYDGDETTYEGYGSPDDPLVGGVYST